MLRGVTGLLDSDWQNLAGIFDLGGDFTLLGLSLPGLITFLLFWLVNVGIGFGGGKVLNKFTAILNPCIYIVFGGMAIWAISLVGLGPIFDYIPSGIQKAENSGFLFLVVINAVVAVWAAPAVSASDFTQNAHSFREQALGQTLGLVVAYILFAVAGYVLLPEPVFITALIPGTCWILFSVGTACLPRSLRYWLF